MPLPNTLSPEEVLQMKGGQNSASSALPDILSPDEVIAMKGGAPESTMEKSQKAATGLFSTIGGALISNEKNLGESIAGALPSSLRGQTAVEKARQEGQDIQTKILQKIQEKRAAGEDVSKLEKGLLLDQTPSDFELNPALNKTPLQIAGEGAGTALDALTAGTLSTAAKSLKLLRVAGDVAESKVPTLASAIVKNIEGNAPSTVNKLVDVGKRYMANAAKFGAIGYGYDVSNKMQSGETGTSDLTPGLGTLLGATLPLGPAIKGVAAAVRQPTAETIINSLIKPLLKDFAYGKNPGRAVSAEKITGNSLDNLAQNIASRRAEVGQTIGQITNRLDAQVGKMPQGKFLGLPAMTTGGVLEGKGLEISQSLKPIDEAMQIAAKNNNQSVIDRLQKVKESLTTDLSLGFDESGNPLIQKGQPKNLSNASYGDAFNMKKRIGDMTQWTGNASDDKIVNKALKETYGNLKDTMESAAEHTDPELAAQLKQANERYGDLTSAEIATKYRDKIESRQNILKFVPQLATFGGIAVSLLSGNPLPALIGMGEAGVQKALGSTLVKSHVASWLANESPGVIENFMKRYPKTAEIIHNAFSKDLNATEKGATIPTSKSPSAFNEVGANIIRSDAENAVASQLKLPPAGNPTAYQGETIRLGAPSSMEPPAQKIGTFKSTAPANVSPTMFGMAKEMEATDHPELAKSNPEAIAQIVNDEFKADPAKYKKDVQKFTKKIKK
jgi:hypothetical protein